MPIHDLGYKAYTGARRPPSANLWTLARQGLRRAIAPFTVKASLIAAGFAVIIYPIVFLVASFAKVTTSRGTRDLGAALSPEGFVRGIFDWQLWLFVFVITIAAGAGAVADDVRHRAFQFYFAKPVTREQYMFGRIYPVAFLSFLLTFGPALVLIGLAVFVAPDKAEASTRAGLVFPSLMFSVAISCVMAVVSVAVSSLSRSKGLTMSVWVAIFFLPHMVAVVVRLVTKSTWLYLLSLPGSLGILGDAIFKRAIEGSVGGWHALAALVAVITGSVLLLRKKLLDVEIIG